MPSGPSLIGRRQHLLPCECKTTTDYAAQFFVEFGMMLIDSKVSHDWFACIETKNMLARPHGDAVNDPGERFFTNRETPLIDRIMAEYSMPQFLQVAFDPLWHRVLSHRRSNE
jgi:hypothetical protein